MISKNNLVLHKDMSQKFRIIIGDIVNCILSLRKFRSANVLRILKSLCSGSKRFFQLKAETQLNDAVLLHYLRKLLDYGIVQRETKGIYALKFRTPICYLFALTIPHVYIGFLGLRQGRDIPEPVIALDLLERVGIRITKNYVFTTSDALATWEDYELSDFNVKILKKSDLLDISVMERKIEQVLVGEAKKNLLIMDCTSLTKTATIAMYNLARKYCIPLIYVYEGTKELVWLIDIETVKNEVISRIIESKKSGRETQ